MFRSLSEILIKRSKKINCLALKERGIFFKASSSGGFHPRSKERGISAAERKVVFKGNKKNSGNFRRNKKVFKKSF